MSKIHVDFIRGKEVESRHQVKVLITNANGKTLLSTENDNEFLFPRSSIKIFQAIPFAMSNAIKDYRLSNKHIALACASHKGEKFHIRELKKWISKINLKTKISQLYIITFDKPHLSCLCLIQTFSCQMNLKFTYDVTTRMLR